MKSTPVVLIRPPTHFTRTGAGSCAMVRIRVPALCPARSIRMSIWSSRKRWANCSSVSVPIAVQRVLSAIMRRVMPSTTGLLV
ncbi:hypothetical protein D3C87_1655040 [compost metagenome]